MNVSLPNVLTSIEDISVGASNITSPLLKGVLDVFQSDFDISIGDQVSYWTKQNLLVLSKLLYYINAMDLFCHLNLF